MFCFFGSYFSYFVFSFISSYFCFAYYFLLYGAFLSSNLFPEKLKIPTFEVGGEVNRELVPEAAFVTLTLLNNPEFPELLVPKEPRTKDALFG